MDCGALCLCSAFVAFSTLCTSPLGCIKNSPFISALNKPVYRPKKFMFTALLVVSAPGIVPSQVLPHAKRAQIPAVRRLEARPSHVTCYLVPFIKSTQFVCCELAAHRRSPFHDIEPQTVSAINSWVSQFPPPPTHTPPRGAHYYYQTCPCRPHAFIAAALQCVDKSTYERLMANNKIANTHDKNSIHAGG